LRRAAVRCTVTALLGAEPREFVTASFADIEGRRWEFHDKPEIFLSTPEPLPATGGIRCKVLEAGPYGYRVSTATPDGLEAVNGETTFLIPADSLILGE
jgi:hypothetical protein